MPRLDYARCKDCKGARQETGPLSCTRLCSQCAERRLRENVFGIHEKHGPAYERRRYGIARAEFGPRVALALKQAGVFDAEQLDALERRP